MKLTIPVLKTIGEWSKKYANLPERFIKRKMEMIYWKTPRGKPQYLPRTHERKRCRFSLTRPWTQEFQVANMRDATEYIYVEPIKNWSFFRGDLVEILEGPDEGKQGTVQDIIQERNWIIVEGLNTKLQHYGKTKTFPGLYARVEQPLLVTTQVLLVDPSDMQGTKIEWRYTETGEHVRVSCRTGRIIPMPVSAHETIDYKSPGLYVEQPKDTKEADAIEVTFEPALKTFEMDIMDKMGIKEDRIPRKLYWY